MVPLAPHKRPAIPPSSCSLLAVALAILSGLFALSCGKSEQRLSPDGRIHVVYWEKWSGMEQEAMEEIVELFNNSQDRIYVEYVPINDIRGRLLLATAGGDPPDVAGVFGETILKYSERGAILPLDDLMERDGISPGDYLPSVIQLCQYHGFTWGLPSTPASIALHYNKRLFREAGLDPERPPQTIEELNEYARMLTKVGENGEIIQLGFSPVEPFWFKPWWIWWFGGRHWDEESQMTLNTQENLRCFRWIRSFPEEYGVDALQRFESSGGQIRSAQNLFLDERIAMQLQGVWMANFIETYNPDMEWGAAPFPAFSEDMAEVTFVDTDILVIPKGARHPHEAWEFIRFVQRQENIERLCFSQHKFSPLRQVSPDFYMDHPNPEIDLFRRLAESPNAHPVPRMPIVEELREEMIVAVDKVWLRTSTPEQALADAQKKMQALLDRAMRQWNRVSEGRHEDWSEAWKESDL